VKREVQLTLGFTFIATFVASVVLGFSLKPAEASEASHTASTEFPHPCPLLSNVEIAKVVGVPFFKGTEKRRSASLECSYLSRTTRANVVVFELQIYGTTLCKYGYPPAAVHRRTVSRFPTWAIFYRTVPPGTQGDWFVFGPSRRVDRVCTRLHITGKKVTPYNNPTRNADRNKRWLKTFAEIVSRRLG
jgi:hypothetical protein